MARGLQCDMGRELPPQSRRAACAKDVRKGVLNEAEGAVQKAPSQSELSMLPHIINYRCV